MESKRKDIIFGRKPRKRGLRFGAAERIEMLRQAQLIADKKVEKERTDVEEGPKNRRR